MASFSLLCGKLLVAQNDRKVFAWEDFLKDLQWVVIAHPLLATCKNCGTNSRQSVLRA